MQMKALKTFRHSASGQVVAPGSQFDEPSRDRARHYESQGFAVPAPSTGVARRAVRGPAEGAQRLANKAAAAGPLASPPGGPTGGASSASSSPADPAPPARTSRRSKAAPGS